MFEDRNKSESNIKISLGLIYDNEALLQLIFL